MIPTLATWTARAAGSLLPSVVTRLPVSARTVFLTFDDGPSATTPDLLDLLKKYDAKATFFLQGNQIESHRTAAEQIVRAGHGIGNHSFQHLDAWSNPWRDVREDLVRGSESILSLTGAPPVWMRPPYGRFNRETLDWCKDIGQRLALWDIMAGDFEEDATPTGVVTHIMSLVRPGSLIVLHDGDAHQPRALGITESVLSALVDDGWAFEALPDSH